jgi:hypothetical protein
MFNKVKDGVLYGFSLVLAGGIKILPFFWLFFKGTGPFQLRDKETQKKDWEK